MKTKIQNFTLSYLFKCKIEHVSSENDNYEGKLSGNHYHRINEFYNVSVIIFLI